MSSTQAPLQKLGGRKFVLTFMLTLIYTILLMGDYVSKEIFQALMISLVGMFFGANVGQKFIVKEKETTSELEIAPKQ